MPPSVRTSASALTALCFAWSKCSLLYRMNGPLTAPSRSATYHGQTLSLPIILSHEHNEVLGFWTAVLPCTALGLFYYFDLRPRRRRQRIESVSLLHHVLQAVMLTSVLDTSKKHTVNCVRKNRTCSANGRRPYTYCRTQRRGICTPRKHVMASLAFRVSRGACSERRRLGGSHRFDNPRRAIRSIRAGRGDRRPRRRCYRPRASFGKLEPAVRPRETEQGAPFIRCPFFVCIAPSLPPR